MIREIVFDTETTGFDPATGDRVVEIGAIELINHLPTKNHFHVYLNPDRAMPAEALAVHGLGDDFLRDKPRFAEVADRFLDFIGPDARLIAHNADFDIRFLNAELRLAKRPELRPGRALDTAGSTSSWSSTVPTRERASVQASSSRGSSTRCPSGASPGGRSARRARSVDCGRNCTRSPPAR